MGARAGATTKLRMRGSFIRMGSCYARTARRASYASPPQFPGGTVARGTPAEKNLGATSREKQKPCPQPSLRCRFRKTHWYKSGIREQRLATHTGKRRN